MGIKITYFIYEIIKTHSSVAFSTFYITHFFRQFVALKKNLVDSSYFYAPLVVRQLTLVQYLVWRLLLGKLDS